jgi:hypothetical protein
VKRKRKEAKKESKAKSVHAADEQHKGQPDLAVLSKGLPSGWQVSILPRSIYAQFFFDHIADTSTTNTNSSASTIVLLTTKLKYN